MIQVLPFGAWPPKLLVDDPTSKSFVLARAPQKQILSPRRARFGTRLYLRGCAETGTLSSSRVWCAPAGPARTARREPARPSRACWRAVACTSPSTRRNALCRLCVVAHGLGWRGWPAGTETPTHCGWPRLAKAWRPPCACSGASGAGGRVSWPPPRAAGSPRRFAARFATRRVAATVQALAVESDSRRAHALERREVLGPHLAVGERGRRHLSMRSRRSMGRRPSSSSSCRGAAHRVASSVASGVESGVASSVESRPTRRLVGRWGARAWYGGGVHVHTSVVHGAAT